MLAKNVSHIWQWLKISLGCILLIIIIIIKSLLKHASTQSKAHKTKTGSGKGQASYIRPNIYAEKSNVCNLLLKQDIRLVLK